ncbi:hypothetical protein ACJJIF_07330 [Microbulbifer sp. SSSA002]|uniref:hypothetical protein n=1 Tax=unclassified Microbulbifer TaxID=2619833 RepID=UPI00403A4B5D
MPFVSLQWAITWQVLGEPQHAAQILDQLLEHSEEKVVHAAEQIKQLNALEGECPEQVYLECEEELGLLVTTYARAIREVEHFGDQEPGFYELVDRQFVSVDDNRRYSAVFGKLNDFLLDVLQKRKVQAEEARQLTEERALQKAQEAEAAQLAVEKATAQAMAVQDSASSIMQLQLQLTTGLLSRDVDQVAQVIHQALGADEASDAALKAQLIKTVATTIAPHFFTAALPWDSQLSMLATVLTYADATTFTECSDDFLEAAAFAAQITASPLFDDLLQQRIDRQGAVDTARLQQKTVFFQGNYADASAFDLGDESPVEMAFYTALSAALSGNMDKAAATLEGVDASGFTPSFANFELLQGLVTGYATLMAQLADFQPAIERALMGVSHR